jgi:ABC-type dipeptide/oligopeptide/nickel transport system permease component
VSIITFTINFVVSRSRSNDGRAQRDKEVRDNIRRENLLDQPLIVQYGAYVGRPHKATWAARTGAGRRSPTRSGRGCQRR